MRIIIIFLLFAVVSCHSAVRYTSTGNVAYNQPSDNDQTDINDSDGAVDASRMGKIIAGYLRTPYQEGGTGKLGIDCSGLVYVVYRDYNATRLPRNTGKLFRNLKNVKYENARYGDLVFFSFNNSEVSHVGIYVGNDKFVHASKTKGVIISSIKEDYYENNYKGVRRVLW